VYSHTPEAVPQPFDVPEQHWPLGTVLVLPFFIVSSVVQDLVPAVRPSCVCTVMVVSVASTWYRTVFTSLHLMFCSSPSGIRRPPDFVRPRQLASTRSQLVGARQQAQLSGSPLLQALVSMVTSFLLPTQWHWAVTQVASQEVQVPAAVLRAGQGVEAAGQNQGNAAFLLHETCDTACGEALPADPLQCTVKLPRN
jgi:hypothetical protein